MSALPSERTTTLSPTAKRRKPRPKTNTSSRRESFLPRTSATGFATIAERRWPISHDMAAKKKNVLKVDGKKCRFDSGFKSET